ncbi:TPA: AIPR family protein [Bacillus cereus]
MAPTKYIKIPVVSMRTLPCPHGRDKLDPPQKTYIAICDVCDIPNNIPMGTNPRSQNTKTKVAKNVTESLLTDPDFNFHLLNRGIVISADSVKYDNEKNEIFIYFTDGEKHGNIDGGHTYTIIKQHQEKLERNQQFVRLEIITGIESFFEQLAGARNTSVQVQDKSLAELEKKFDIIKNALKDTSFIDKVAFKENAEGKIDVYDIVAILTMFNIKRFSSDIQPIITYSGKKKCTDYYLQDIKEADNSFKKMQPIMQDIFDLYNYIEQKLPEMYKLGVDKGRYGAVKGVISKEGHVFPLRFSEETVAYQSPNGFIYPILAAFRALVEEKNGQFQWKNNIDPKQYFDQLGPEMTRDTVERSRTLGNNPQSVGKDSNHWSQLYKTVSNKYMTDILQRLGAI